jgi:hypothetical protein
MLDINSFDGNAIIWRELPDGEHVWLSNLDVDETAKIVDTMTFDSMKELCAEAA